MPTFVKSMLESEDLFDEYKSRPAYQQNDYIGWIMCAKQKGTQQKRLQQMLDELHSGDIYMKMKWKRRAK